MAAAQVDNNNKDETFSQQIDKVNDNYTAYLTQAPFETANFADLYPERKGNAIAYTKSDYMKGKARSESYKQKCGVNVVNSIHYSPLIKIMLGALSSQGCLTDSLERYISCDICKEGKFYENQGGYDEINNQVFVCANNSKNYGIVHGTILRNLITMFDACTRKVDFKNVNHLACTEVRKANLASCNFMIHFTRNDSEFGVKDQHAKCVANTAVDCLEMKINNRELAKQAVSHVFSKCYNDLEPIGRKCRNNVDMKRAYSERYLYGYE